MMQVGAAVIATRIAITVFIQRRSIILVLGITDFYHTVSHEQMAVTGITRWHHAVEHIDTATHAFNQVFRLADAHQVTRLIFRNLRANMFKNAVHILFWLTDRQAAHSVTIKTDIHQPFY
ncbi:hypothetical protein D3C72_1309930 [compost metagenome]